MTTNEYIRKFKESEFKSFSEKIWQKSYFEHIIRDENDYITKAQYILNNSLKPIYEPACNHADYYKNF